MSEKKFFQWGEDGTFPLPLKISHKHYFHTRYKEIKESYVSKIVGIYFAFVRILFPTNLTSQNIKVTRKIISENIISQYLAYTLHKADAKTTSPIAKIK